MPDKETFLTQFKHFDLVEVNESDKYLIETLNEEYLYSRMVPFVHKIADLAKVDSREAVEYAKTEIEKISKISVVFKIGYDIVKNAMDRQKDFEERLNKEGLLGIPTGIEELDKITHGWLSEDLIVIVGRTNEGKSWLLLFFLIVAWLHGNKVLLYSGEMSNTVVGYRFDTIHGHFSNGALMQGDSELGEGLKADDYKKYLQDLAKKDQTFIVVTPKDLGGRRMNIQDLHRLIEQEDPAIIGVDQISLMDDYRAKKGDQDRMKFTHVSEDLFLTSEKYGKPILAPAQAGRDAEKEKKDDEGNPKTPELHQIAESDGIPQNATRVLAMRQVGLTLKITLRKNRYGKRNQEIMMLWDIDKGVMKPFMAVSTNKEGEAVKTKKLAAQGEDLF